MAGIASSIAAGNGFSWPVNPPEPTSWIPPVYPLIMAGVFNVFGTYSTTSAVVLQLFQAITSALSCVLLFFIGKRLFNAQVGLLGALALAIYPYALYFSVHRIRPTTLFVFCLLLVILQFLKLVEAPTLKKSILIGVSLGITSLIDPIIFAFWPFGLGWVFFTGQANWKRRVGTIAVVLVTLSATISPWLVRNYVVFGRFVFIKSNFSRELWYGNAGWDLLSIADRRYLDGADEGEQSTFYRKKAFQFIGNHPLQFVRLTAIRFSRFWMLTKSKPGLAATIARISYLVLLVLGAAGVCLSLHKGRNIHLLLLAMLSLPIPYYLTNFARFRYRFPIEPILMVFAGYAIWRLYDLSKVNRMSLYGGLIGKGRDKL